MKRGLYTLAAALLLSMAARAQSVTIEVDADNLAQVLANTAVQQSIERLHNQSLEDVRDMKAVIAAAASAMAEFKILHREALQEVKSFRQESVIWSQIVRYGGECADLAVQAGKGTLGGEQGMLGTATFITQGDLAALTAHVASLATDFTNIVTAARDSHNMIPRKQRMEMALSIHADVMAIRMLLRRVTRLQHVARWRNLIRAWDRHHNDELLRRIRSKADQAARRWESSQIKFGSGGGRNNPGNAAGAVSGWLNQNIPL